MSILIAGLLVFLGIHSVSIFAESWRDSMVSSLGALRWRGLYSLVSIIGLVLIIWGYGLARQAPVVVYVPPTWLRHLALLLLLPVFPLLLATYFPGRIRDRVGHPSLLAVKIWALSHLLSNGTLADLLLFGSFLLWAGIDRASMKRRVPRAIATAPIAPANDLIAGVGGLLIYGVLVIWGHQWLIGVAPMPF